MSSHLRIALCCALATALPGCNGAITQSTSPYEQIKGDQQALDLLAKSLAVKYTVISNHRDANCLADRVGGNCFEAEISFTPSVSIDINDWEIYFSHTAPVQTVNSDDFSITHINGDLHRISPTKAFKGFKAGQTQGINFRADYWHLSETDPMPNYYVTAPKLQARIIESSKTKTDAQTGLEIRPYVSAFTDDKKQFRRSESEKTQWSTAEQLYKVNNSPRLSPTQVSNAIIPTPSDVRIDPAGSTLDLSKGIDVLIDKRWRKDIEASLKRLESFGVKESQTGAPLEIHIKTETKGPKGAYTLDISTEKMSIAANDAAGAAYALQSVASLFDLGRSTLPVMSITDQPRYEFRGVLLDVARNFHSKSQVLKLLDQMAAYKLNNLHLHLADDEGWRLEIPGLPELTRIGSKRCHDLSESRCLIPQLGSGPIETSNINGFYSTKDYQEILQAAKERHIQVIPSLDMPGHSRAAIVSMSARYKHLLAAGQPEQAKQYQLHDPHDTTEYRSVQFYKDNTLNVCMETTYTFIAKVIDEVKKIHTDAGHPLKRYHIGADETAGAWGDSPECARFLANNDSGITQIEQLGSYFVERIAGMLSERDIEPAAWSDGIARTNKANMPSIVQANSWGTLFWDGHKEAHELAARGWDVVLSTPDVTYFDFPYEADPKERGYYWGSRSTNSKKVFEFMPDNLAAHAEIWEDRQGNDMELTAQAENKQHRFSGLQAQLWSETTRTDEQVDYLFFPRLIALAERAWHRAEWELPFPDKTTTYNKHSGFFTSLRRDQREQDWNHFISAVGYKELPKLDVKNIHYRIPTVGATIENGILRANILIPGLGIEYQEDAGPWTPYLEPTAVSDVVFIRARSANGKRAGRALQVKP